MRNSRENKIQEIQSKTKKNKKKERKKTSSQYFFLLTENMIETLCSFPDFSFCSFGVCVCVCVCWLFFLSFWLFSLKPERVICRLSSALPFLLWWGSYYNCCWVEFLPVFCVCSPSSPVSIGATVKLLLWPESVYCLVGCPLHQRPSVSMSVNMGNVLVLSLFLPNVFGALRVQK
jgi:hypothetical protein